MHPKIHWNITKSHILITYSIYEQNAHFARYTRRHQLWVNLTQKVFRVERAIASYDYPVAFLYYHVGAHSVPMWVTALSFGYRQVVTPRTASYDYDWLLSQYQCGTHFIPPKLTATYLTQLFLKNSVVESGHYRRLKLIKKRTRCPSDGHRRRLHENDQRQTIQTWVRS